MGIFSKLFGGSKEASNTTTTGNHPSDINQEADEVIEDKEIIVRKFFRTELYNPAKYIPLAYDSYETANGNMEYDVALDSPELGVFNKMEIIIFQSTSVANVIFIADNGRVTDELRLFIIF